MGDHRAGPRTSASAVGSQAIGSHWRRNRVLALVVSALLAVGLAAATNPSKVFASASTSTSAVQDLCNAPAPGQAGCLSERLVDPGRGRAEAMGAGTSRAGMPGGYGPSDLASAYQLDTRKGFGRTVAIVDAYDDPTAASDLSVYRSQFGLPACTKASGCFTKVNQSGNSAPLPAPSTGWAGEISLDLEMVSAICPNCKILLVEANSSYLSDLGSAVDTAVRLGARFVSNSYGAPESSAVSYYDSHYNHPGVAITASTGDGGYGVSYPASSAYVTAVGGTSLQRSSGGRGWSEVAWSGAGSGCASYTAQPSMQASIGTGCANRAVADVSAVANPYTGVAVYGSYGGGGWGIYGGTSVAAPVIAGIYALAGTPGDHDYPNSYPYRNASSLHDVASGSNGSCPARAWCNSGAGWDGPTGLGTPNTAAAFSPSGEVSGNPIGFGAIVQIGAPVIAGLGVPLSVTPVLPNGDSLASVAWKAARSDCTFDAPAAAQSTFTCPASLVGTTSVTVTLSDTQGATKAVTLPLTFTVGAQRRPVSLSLTMVGQASGNPNICTSAAVPVQAVVTDAATGSPIKGLLVVFTKQNGSGAVSVFGSAISALDGTARSRVGASAASTLRALTNATGAFGGAVTRPLSITPVRCAARISSSGVKSFSNNRDRVGLRR